MYSPKSSVRTEPGGKKHAVIETDDAFVIPSNGQRLQALKVASNGLSSSTP